jgi:hypothetical protein
MIQNMTHIKKIPNPKHKIKNNGTTNHVKKKLCIKYTKTYKFKKKNYVLKVQIIKMI